MAANMETEARGMTFTVSNVWSKQHTGHSDLNNTHPRFHYTLLVLMHEIITVTPLYLNNVESRES